jgi:hypothetical protein
MLEKKHAACNLFQLILIIIEAYKLYKDMSFNKLVIEHPS